MTDFEAARRACRHLKLMARDSVLWLHSDTLEPGLIGVGVGNARSGGLCVRAYVRPWVVDLVPPEVDGVPVEVQVSTTVSSL